MNKKKLVFSYFKSTDNKQIRWGKALSANNPVKGIILLLNGRSEFMEKYQKIVYKLTLRGYNVMTLDWRGQGLSVRELENKQKGYVKDFNYYLDDLKLFYNSLVKPQQLPVTILAHSMGGHIALRFMAESNEKIEKAVLVCPMVDIVTNPIPRTIAGKIADYLVKYGLGNSYLTGKGDYCRSKVRFKNNKLTHSLENFWLEHQEIEKNKELAIGDVTWAWLKYAFDSIKILNKKEYLKKIKTPVLLLSANQDIVVSINAQKKLCRKMANCNLISIPQAFHEILFEVESVRKKFWNYFDEFIKRA